MATTIRIKSAVSAKSFQTSGKRALSTAGVFRTGTSPVLMAGEEVVAVVAVNQYSFGA
jgi:hypothetical protein